MRAHEFQIFGASFSAIAIGNQPQVFEICAQQPQHFVYVPQFEVVPRFERTCHQPIMHLNVIESHRLQRREGFGGIIAGLFSFEQQVS